MVYVLIPYDKIGRAQVRSYERLVLMVKHVVSFEALSSGVNCL